MIKHSKNESARKAEKKAKLKAQRKLERERHFYFCEHKKGWLMNQE
jgi:hypothetical protein